MKKVHLLVVLFLASLFPFHSFGQVAAIKSGDTIVREFYKAAQVANNPVSFDQRTGGGSNTVQIGENGQRNYLSADGTVQFAHDSSFTPIITGRTPVAPEYRFTRFPQGQKPVAGMKWTPPRWKNKNPCGDVENTATAIAESGPEMPVSINDKVEQVKTVKITYTISVSGCQRWNRTFEILYSPDLNELVRSTQTEWHTEFGDGKNFLFSGNGIVLTGVRTK